MVTHTFEVVPAGWQHGQKIEGLGFEPFILDVPAFDHTDVEQAKSARRAYFTALSTLRHFEPEDFAVFEYFQHLDPARGREVGPGGFKVAA
jgi:hypothetical protein